MRVTTLVNKLIGLQGLWVRGFHFQADKARVVVDVVPRRRKPLCGICGRKVRKNKDRYNRYWRHLDLFGVRTYLRYSIRRVVCRRCGVVREKVPWADKGSRFTKSFEQEVAWLAQRTDVSAVANYFRVNGRERRRRASTSRRLSRRQEFLNKFAVPMGFSGYGSTEAGGLCHIWPWRLAGRHPEGMSRFGGAPRRDVEWDLTEDGEILVRAQRPHILSSGYRTASGTAPLTDENGWFHTGDLGRRDEYGHLVFIERKADSIRVKGEYVPIAFVEEAFAAIYEVEELALWRRDSDLVDQEPILYVVAPNVIPDGKIREVSQSLPRFMRPVAVVRVDALPRNEGVGKINRRLLETLERLEVVELNRQG